MFSAERNMLVRYMLRCGSVTLHRRGLARTAREIGMSPRDLERAIDACVWAGLAHVEGDTLRLAGPKGRQ